MLAAGNSFGYIICLHLNIDYTLKECIIGFFNFTLQNEYPARNAINLHVHLQGY
jgi:hypothetical protein